MEKEKIGGNGSGQMRKLWTVDDEQRTRDSEKGRDQKTPDSDSPIADH